LAQQLAIEMEKKGFANLFVHAVAPTTDSALDADNIFRQQAIEDLDQDLQAYIDLRKNEWGFHYNFLGLVSIIYYIHDCILGTDYYNSKSKDIKVSAATNLQRLIYDDDDMVLTTDEKHALAEGRLGALVQKHGGLETIMDLANMLPDLHSHFDDPMALQLN